MCRLGVGCVATQLSAGAWHRWVPLPKLHRPPCTMRLSMTGPHPALGYEGHLESEPAGVQLVLKPDIKEPLQ